MVDPVRGAASNGASEAKGPGGISKDGTQPNAAGAPLQSQTTEAEVHILEEHVTHAAQKPVQSPAPPVTNPPRPSGVRPDATTDDVGLVLQPKKAPGTKTPPAPSPLPLNEKPLSSAEVKKFTAPDSGEPALGDDIAKILAAVKLPEHRDAKLPSGKNVPGNPASTGASQGGPKRFDTGIVGSALEDSPASAPPPIAPAQEPKATPANIPSTVIPPSVVSGETKAVERSPSSVTAVHTLKDDLRGVVYNQKISVVKAVSLEEDRRAHKGPDAGEISGTQQRSNRTFGIVFASLTLLGLGAGALFGVLFIMNQKKVAPQIDTGSSMLFAEQSVLLSLDPQSPAELKRALEAGRATSQGALGSITRIIPVTAATSSDDTPQNRPATFREFMAAIGAHPPDEVLRALRNDFFLGIHAADKSAPLIVIPVTSHARAFEAMLGWEESLNPDLAPLFTAVPVFTQDGNGVPSKRTYEDLVMRNYDVRALKDDTGEIQLYYSFPTQNILIIAESPYSFPEILSRLQASRQL